MKELYVTKEMQKFQDDAIADYTNNNRLNTEWVVIGWKLDAGRILYDATRDITIELLSRPVPHQTAVVKIGMNGKESETSIKTIARAIVTKQVEVYYSK